MIKPPPHALSSRLCLGIFFQAGHSSIGCYFKKRIQHFDELKCSVVAGGLWVNHSFITEPGILRVGAQ